MNDDLDDGVTEVRVPLIAAVCETCAGEGTIEEDAYTTTRGSYTRTAPCPTCEHGMELQADNENAAFHDAGWRDE